MFTDKKIRERFTDEEFSEFLRLLSLPENELLARFVRALVDDRTEVIGAYLEKGKKK